jgi:DNA invertase Pin-like site-specific DNA recombinase
MAADRKALRCAVYTRKSSEEGLEQAFNSLDAQREACQAFILSQRHEGWRLLPAHYDDGGFSGGTLERPALTRLLAEIDAGKIDVVVVYKVDRLTRSLSDFARIVERFDAQGVSFVSVTQQFNTTSSMGRLTLNVLLSFAQFEREVTGERIRDKIAASKRKGMWMGGQVPLGYDLLDRKLVINPDEAARVQHIYQRYTALGCVAKLQAELDKDNIRSKLRLSKTGSRSGGVTFSRGALYRLLNSRLYLGETVHKRDTYPGQHDAIVPKDLWDKVQALLQDNCQAKETGLRAKAPSLLAGLLFDAAGNRFTPSHAVKNGKRYRYYVSQAVIQHRPSQASMPARIPAHDVEALVSGQLCVFLSRPQEVLDALSEPDHQATHSDRVVTAAKKQAALWVQQSTAEKRAFLLACVARITMHEEGLEILLDKAALGNALLNTPIPSARHPSQRMDGYGGVEDAALFRLTVKARLKRCGGEVRLIALSASEGDVPARHNAALLKALARARAWHEKLLSGEAKSLRAIAKEIGVTERYVSRIIRCAFLAPTLIEAILQGRQPPELTLDKMLGDMPIDWAKQTKEMEFSSRH